MNILLLCKRYYTNKDLIADRFGRLYYFPKFWAAQGHHVTVVAANYKSIKAEKTFSDQMCFYSLPFPSLGIDFFLRLMRISQQAQPHIIVASSDSHFGYLGFRLARRRAVPFVFDLYHHYADFGSNKILGMKAMYYKALREARLVVTDSAALKKKVSDYNARILVAEQGTDPTVFKQMDRGDCQKMLKLDGNVRYIGYTGALDERFDLKTMLEAISNIQQTHKNIKLLIAGPNLACLDLFHPAIHYLGNLPQETIPFLINACELMVIPYQQTKLSSTCNPCKLSEYIACKSPIVASNISTLSDYLPLSKDLLYTPGDANALAASLLRQLERPIIEVFPASLTWESIAQKYLEELENLAKGI